MDAWIASSIEVKNDALLAHARELATQVDRAPKNSPLHGRYSRALELLLDDVERDRPLEENEMELLLWLRTECKNPHQHQHAQAGLHCALCCAEGAYRSRENGHHHRRPEIDLP